MQLKSVDGKRAVFSDPQHEKVQNSKAKRADIAGRQNRGKLTLEDIYQQNELILDLLEQLLEK